MKARVALLFLTFAFPLGIWLGLLGYELPSMVNLFWGWGAIVALAEVER